MSSTRASADRARGRRSRAPAPGLAGLPGPLLALLVAGCAPRPAVPVDPAAFASVAVDPAAGRARAQPSWVASGRLEARIEGRGGRGRLRVIFVAPHRLRADIELSGFFGLFGARSVLWAGEGELIWKEGAAAPERVDADSLFAPVLGQAAGVRELEMLLFGLPALWSRWPDGARVQRRGKEYLLAADLADGSTETAWVSGSPPVLRRLERRDPHGRLVMAARFDRHRVIAGVPVARRLTIRAPARGNRLRIDWQRLEADWPEAVSALGWPGG